MSKFIENLRMIKTRRMVAIPGPITFELETFRTGHTGSDSMPEYRLTSAFRQSFVCAPEDLGRVLESGTRQLKELFYGDLREKLIRVERALWETNILKARDAIREVMKEIY